MASTYSGTKFFTQTSVNETEQLDFILTYSKASSSTENNSTALTIRAYLYYHGGVSSVNSNYSTFKIDGTNIKTGSYSAKRNDYLLLGSISKTVYHNSDGTFPKTGISYSINSYHWQSTTKDTAYIDAGSIDEIPRSSVIAEATNVTLPGYCNIKWTPASTSYRYKITFSIGSTNLYTTSVISPATTSLYTYEGYYLNYTIANHITNSKTGTVTATLKTYSDSACTKQVGSSQSKSFTVTIPDNSTTKPTVNLTVAVDNSGNSTVSDWGLYVAGYSKAKLTITGNPKYNASISNFTISGGTYSGVKAGTKTSASTTLAYTGGVIKSSGTKSFSVYATDSRGISSDVVSGFATVYPYSKPSITSFSVKRDENVPTTARISAGWSYSTVNSKNKVQASLYRKLSTNSSWGNPIASVSLGTTTSKDWENKSISDSASYDYRLVVTDSLGNLAESISSISTAAVLLDFKANGKGLGIGKMAEEDALEVALPAEFNNSVVFNELVEFNGSVLINPISLSDGTNLQSIMTKGLYVGGDIRKMVDRISGVMTNVSSTPISYVDSSTGFLLEVLPIGGSPRLMQRVTLLISTEYVVFTRFGISGLWTRWVLNRNNESISATSATTKTSNGDDYFLSTSTNVGTVGSWKVVPITLETGYQRATITTTVDGVSGYYKILKDERITSSFFSFTEDGGITCKRDGLVQVSGHIRVSGATSGNLISGAIYKLADGDTLVLSNGYNIGGVYDDIAASTSSSSSVYANVTLPPVNIKVDSGDSFYLMMRNNNSTNGHTLGSDCIMTVTYIS